MNDQPNAAAAVVDITITNSSNNKLTTDSSLATRIEELSVAYANHQRQYKSNPRIMIASRSTSSEILRRNQVNLKNTVTVGSASQGIDHHTTSTNASLSNNNNNNNNNNTGSGVVGNNESTAVRRLLSGSHSSSEFRLGAAGRDREVTTSYTESLDELLTAAKNQAEGVKRDLNRMSVVCEEAPGSPIVEKSVSTPRRVPQLQVSVGGESEDWQDVEQQYEYSFPANIINSNSGGDSPLSPGVQDEFGFIQYTSMELAQNRPKPKEVVGTYVLGDVLGEGQYGKVKEGFCIQTLKRVAVKIMRLSRIKKIPGGEQNIRQEISILKRLRHKNIVELINVIYDPEKEKFYEVFEYCAGTLSQLQSHAVGGKLPLGQSQRYFRHLVRGLQYLQSKSIVHHDIKPANLILSVDDCLKIADFGLAEEIAAYKDSDLVVTGVGTPAFQAPETAAAQPHCSGYKIDIWASGVTLYNMISGRYPFDGSNNYTLFESIMRCEYSMPLEADSQLADLLYGILEKDPAKRLTIEMISAHPWLKIEYARHPDEVPVTSILYEFDVYDNDSGQNEDSTNTLQSPTAQSSNASSLTAEEWSQKEEKARLRRKQRGHLSNPRFAHDTSLIPYLELMFDDLPMMLRRSSVVDKYHKQHRQQRQQKKTDKFLRRLSRPFQLTHQHEDSIQYPQQTVPPSPKSTSPSRLSARFGLSPRVGRSKSNAAQTALVVPNNNNHTSTAGGQGGCGMQ